MKKMLIAILFMPMLAFASGGEVHLDKWQGSVSDKAALQNGAKLFVNYCLNCHGASYLRYKNLLDLGLTEKEVKDNLMFTSEKIGDLLKVAARSDEQKVWFGATPPDLTIIARARGDTGAPKMGADWLYTYLRTFYRDDNRPTGWNNTTFENVGMPNPLWELQGQYRMDHETHKLAPVTAGTLTPADYDKAISDLVSFMVWMGEPQQGFRQNVGFAVIAFLLILLVFAYALKKEYWKDIH